MTQPLTSLTSAELIVLVEKLVRLQKLEKKAEAICRKIIDGQHKEIDILTAKLARARAYIDTMSDDRPVLASDHQPKG